MLKSLKITKAIKKMWKLNIVLSAFVITLCIAVSVLVIWAKKEDDADKLDGHRNTVKSENKVEQSKKAAGQTENIPGRWHPLKRFREKALTASQEETMKQLESIGYLSGSRPAPEMKNVTIYIKDLACNGLNLLLSGHAPEAILMDMKGNELHRWSCNFWDIWPDFKPFPNSNNHEFWRRVYLFENGDLLAIFDGIGLIKLDKDSHLLWAFRGGAHHDLFVDQDGNIFVLTRKARTDPKYNENKPILEDFISILDPEGNEIKRVSILKSLENSEYAANLKKLKGMRMGVLGERGDLLHTNTVELLDGKLAHRSATFREGNVLISIFTLNLICIVDLDMERVVWALGGSWEKQHQPTILENGRMLLFDNWGNGGKSRVIEFDPFSQEVFWVYTGTPNAPLFSYTCGSSERLPNGNTLITESDAGRALEVTPDQTIVWEFFNPYRAGENDELIATLFEVIRLKPDFPVNWLDKWSDNKQR